jgi:hypothetical protein
LDDFGLFAIDLKNKKKKTTKKAKHKTPPLIERRYKYITHTHTHQASKQERFRLQKATREEEQ